MTKDTSLFIWDKEIKGIKKNVVTFKDGSTETFTEKQLTYIITKTMNDATAERDQLIKAITPEIMTLLEAYNIKQSELGSILESIKSTYRFALDVAVGKAFGTYSATRHPDQYRDNIRISDIARVSGK